MADEQRRDEIDAAVDELLEPLHTFVVRTMLAQRAADADIRRLEAEQDLKEAAKELRAAVKRFADTLRK